MTTRDARRRLFTIVFGVVVLALGMRTAYAQDWGSKPAPKKDHLDDTWSAFDWYARLDVTSTNPGRGSAQNGIAAVTGLSYERMSRTDRYFTWDIDLDYGVGGGSGDLAGLARTYGYVGISPVRRGPVRPFLRLGMGFDFRGDDTYLFSRFDAAMPMAGMRVVSGAWVIDAGALTSWVPTGRFDVLGDEKKLDGSIAWGGFLSARDTDVFWLRAEARAYADTHGVNDATSLAFHACSQPTEMFLMCLEGAGMRGAIASTYGTGDESALFVGVSLGIGMMGAPPSL